MKTLAFLLMLVIPFNAGFTAPEETGPKVLNNVSVDKKTGSISYELSVPARVRIRFGVADGALYRTIVNWEPRDEGKHVESWNGMDPSGKVQLLGRQDLVFTFNYFTEGEEFLQDLRAGDILRLNDNLVGRHLPNLEVNKLHKGHPRECCHEVTIKLSLPGNVKTDKEGYYLIRRKTPIEITIDQKDMRWFTAERYSLHVFLDDVFMQGELDGYTPYRFRFDPSGLNAGKHLITVNLAGFNDHYGIATLPVRIEK